MSGNRLRPTGLDRRDFVKLALTTAAGVGVGARLIEGQTGTTPPPVTIGAPPAQVPQAPQPPLPPLGNGE